MARRCCVAVAMYPACWPIDNQGCPIRTPAKPSKRRGPRPRRSKAGQESRTSGDDVSSALLPRPRRAVVRGTGDATARTSAGDVPGSRLGVIRRTSDATPVDSRRSRLGWEHGGAEAAWASGQGSSGSDLLSGGGGGFENEEGGAIKDHGKAIQVSGIGLSLGIGGCSQFKEDCGEATIGGLGEGSCSSHCYVQGGRHGKTTPGCSPILLGEGSFSKQIAISSCEGLGEGSCSSHCSLHQNDTANNSLILHDRCAISAEEFTSLLARTIDQVSSVRLDSFLCETRQLSQLFSLLIGKKIKQLLVVNRSWPTKLVEFPIDDLEGSQLEVLRICFFRIPEPFAYQLAETLSVLDISHCAVDTQHLYEFIIICTQLKEMHIGYHQSSVKLRSESIKIIQIWMSSIESIDIEHAPSLKSLVASASPKESRKLLGVRVRQSLDLRAITCNMANQSIVINGVDIRMDNTRTCSCLREIHVGVKLLIARQRRYLINSFKCLTQLERINIWRMDEPSPNENSTHTFEDWSQELGVPCCLQHLHLFTLEGFKGGDLESSLACAVLENSSSLQFFTLEFDTDLPRDLVQKTKKSILMVQPKFPHKVSIRIRKTERC